MASKTGHAGWSDEEETLVPGDLLVGLCRVIILDAGCRDFRAAEFLSSSKCRVDPQRMTKAPKANE